MKVSKSLVREVLFGVIGLGSLAISACSQSPQNTTTLPTTPSPSPLPSSTVQTPASGNLPVGSAPDEPSIDIENLAQMTAHNQEFKTLTKALQAADLSATLSGKGPYTIFAPTDQAFAALPNGTLAKLLQPENKAELTKVLTYHMVPHEVTTITMKPGLIKTVEGKSVNIKFNKVTKEFMVDDAKVIQPDIKASNGIIHVVDRVILPPDVSATKP